jgi:hypothetical protein
MYYDVVVGRALRGPGAGCNYRQDMEYETMDS